MSAAALARSVRRWNKFATGRYLRHHRRDDAMIERPKMDWREFTVRIVEALRWPAAFIAIFVILREPINQFIAALVHGLS
jgi:hypothetical protein